jgi:hypothetical protein
MATGEGLAETFTGQWQLEKAWLKLSQDNGNWRSPG